MTAQVTEQAGGSDISSSVAATILFRAEMFRCALKTASLFDGEVVFGGEMHRI